MNYVGKFDAKLSDDLGAHPHSHAQFHVDTVSATHAPSDAIIVPDAHLLFNGDFKRSGVDLVLSADDRKLVLHDYFKGEKHAALASPDGAHLTGDIVDALTGHVQFAQADGSASVSHVIGHVTKLAGTATAIRNGVEITLNVGDNVEKGDVIQSGSNSTLGVTFIDGTVFGLSSNARMVLNEMIYDPNGSSNSSLMSLVAGTISFVAGETAKHGDMKVDTPVATMGIRGTAVLVEIDFSVPGQNGAPNAQFQVLVEPDGTTGNYILFDKVTLAPIATVNQAGQVLSFSNGNFSISNAPLTPDAQKLIIDVFNQKFTDNTNTKSTDTQHSDISVPQTLAPIKLADGTTATAKVLLVTSTGDSSSAGTSGTNGIQHIDGPPLAKAFGNAFTELAGKTADTTDLDIASGTVNYIDINAGDVPTVQSLQGAGGKDLVSFTYQDASHTDVTASLSTQQLLDIAAVEVKLSWAQDSAGKNNGTATWTYSVADKAFDFLAAGETLTLTYTAEVDNNYAPNPEHALASFTITITGTNDAPVITTGPESVTYSGGKFTPGGNLHTVGNVPTTGTLSFADVDLTDSHKVSTALTNASMSGDGAATLDMAALDALAPAPMAAFEQALTAKILAGNDSTGKGSGTVSWSLADLPVYLADFIPTGEVLTLTYTVTVGDLSATTAPGQSAMSVGTQTVTVKITGTATAAVVWIATTQSGSTGDWNDVSNWETGTVPTESDDAIVITNQLQDLTPYYPVTIDAAAFAKTVTMNDFGSTAPEIDNNSSLTIRGEFDLFTDAIVKNTGTISVGRTATGASIPGGSIEVDNKSQLINTGTLILGAGGDFQDQSSISNAGGTIEISGGTLNVLVGIDNTGGTITVDSGATLVLNGGAITGGTIIDNGTIEIVNSSAIDAAALWDGGVTVDANQILTLDGTTVNGTVFTDTAAGASLSVGAGEKLTLQNGAIVNGGTINNAGTLQIETTTGAALNGVNVVNTGGGIIQVDVSGGVPPPLPVVLTLGDGTVVTDGTLSLGNSGKVEIATATTATLDDVTVDNGTGLVPAGIIQVDGTLQINGTSISGGMLGNAGTIDVSGIGNLLSHVQVTNTGTIEILSGALKISSGSISGGGSVKIDGGALFELDGSDTQNIVFVGAHSELQIDGPGSSGSLGGDLVGLAATDELDLRTIGYGLNTTGTYVSNASHTGGILTITDGTHSISMNLVGDYSNAHFAGATDGNGGTLVTLNANDDAPVFATADLAQAATVKEVAGQTGVATADSATPASGTIHFTDIDLTDRPTAAIAQSVTWMAADGVTNLSGSLNQAKLDALENAFVLTQSGNTNNGAIGWSYSVADSALDFLALGETATVASTITLDDGRGGTDATTVTIHITGTNDTPTISATSAVFAEQSNTSQPNPTGSTALDTVSGTISFADVDLTDTHTVNVTGVSASGVTAGLPDQTTLMGWLKLGTLTDSTGGVTGSDAWTFSAQDKSFDYLAVGQQVILSYTAQLDDGHGGVITTPFTVSVTGTNDTPTISATSAAFAELPGTGNTAVDHAGGTVTFADVDLTDTPAAIASFASYSYEAADGTTPLTLTQAQASAVEAALTLTPASGNANNGSVAWSYDLADYNFDFLAAGQNLTLTYDATVSDGHGGVATQPFTVTITGTNDVPVIVGETDPATQTFILAKSPVVLAPGIIANALGLHTETFDNITPGLASNNGLNHGNFFDADLGATFSASGHAGVVVGSSSVTAAPFIGTTDTTPYLSIGANSSEAITFAAEQNTFGLYWGSADSYNTISFYNGTELIVSYTGSDVSPLLANGGQGSFSSNGYAEFVDLAPFNKVVLATSANAFEIDNVSAGFITDSHNQLAGPITGTLSVSDADIGDTLTASVTGDGVVKYDGSQALPSGLNAASLIDSVAVTFDSATTNGGTDVLHWTYNPTNADLDFLEPGDTLSVTFKAQISDGHVTTGDQSLTVNIVGAGGSVVNGTVQNDTFVNVGGNVTIFGNGGQDNFVFKAGFGSATIADFDVSKDAIDIDHTLFANVTQLLAGAVNSGHDTIITDAAHDTITLKNVTVAALTAHQSDFHFT